jgi:molybdenum cofactor cytidylyltransferase
MNLRTALRIKRHDVIALVGAGGKTSAMFRLAHELADARLKVITTTTTKIGAPSDEQTRSFIVEAERDLLLEKTQAALQRHHHVTVACEAYADGKYRGVPVEWVAALRALPNVYAVIVEADGARKLPFKAPRADEPVIPTETTLLLVCAGMKAVGTPLNEEHVCRAAVVAQLTGAPLNAPLTIESMAQVMAHPQGGLKHKPTQTRAVAMLNQADEGRAPLGVMPPHNRPITRYDMARALARLLHRQAVFDEILISTLAQADAIIERWGRVSAVIQAAGAGTRFGGVKQLAPWGETTMIEHIVRIVEQAQTDEVQIVLGAHAAHIQARLSSLHPKSRVVLNPDWLKGMSTSLRTGLKQTRVQPSAALFVNVDQPGISAQLLDRIIETYRQTGAPIVAPRFRGMRGNPVLWDRALFDELQTLSGDMGGREILRSHQRELAWVEVDAEEELTDTDTPEEYRRLKELLGK